jgi:phosphohistidine phosphatase SixA
VLAALGAATLGLRAGPAHTAATDDAAALLPTLGAGATLLMRHTQTTPGVGDPPGWRLDQCASQRNLADEGIAHAKRIGQWFAAQGLRVAGVRNSPWCRTRDTARLAFGRSDDWAALANILDDRSRADAQAAEVRRALQAIDAAEAARAAELHVWVSHGVTIAHIVGAEGIGLAPGEAVVVRAGVSAGQPLRVLGRLRLP